ncbi:MAG TPA: peptidylprolyl isomerase [bacterium]|nr:peptidylprolyl isomerase [bacterium]
MNPRVVTFHYTLTDPAGKTLDSSVGQEPMTYMEGAEQIIPGLEKQIQALKAKDKKKIQVPAAEAYGARDDRFIMNVPLDRLPKTLKIGQQFTITADGNGPPFTVVSVTATHATLDGNHPLAGVDLTFDVEIVEIREATAEEVKHGHAHGAGGHHH